MTGAGFPRWPFQTIAWHHHARYRSIGISEPQTLPLRFSGVAAPPTNNLGALFFSFHFCMYFFACIFLHVFFCMYSFACIFCMHFFARRVHISFLLFFSFPCSPPEKGVSQFRNATTLLTLISLPPPSHPPPPPPPPAPKSPRASDAIQRKQMPYSTLSTYKASSPHCHDWLESTVFPTITITTIIAGHIFQYRI